MKYKGIYFILMTLFIKKPMIRKFGKNMTKESLKKARFLYRQMLAKTDDVGANNPMSLNIYQGYVFMAICRAGNFNVDDFKKIIVEFLNNKFINKAISNMNLNNPKDMQKFAMQMYKMKEWADKHKEYKNNTWDFNFDKNLHRDGLYYHFTRCPMEKFARENGYLDLLPLCCDVDHIIISKRKAVLYRKQTLASGGAICDYWIVGDKVNNPM